MLSDVEQKTKSSLYVTKIYNTRVHVFIGVPSHSKENELDQWAEKAHLAVWLVWKVYWRKATCSYSIPLFQPKWFQSVLVQNWFKSVLIWFSREPAKNWFSFPTIQRHIIRSLKTSSNASLEPLLYIVGFFRGPLCKEIVYLNRLLCLYIFLPATIITILAYKQRSVSAVTYGPLVRIDG